MRKVFRSRGFSRTMLAIGLVLLLGTAVCWTKVYFDNRELYRFSQQFFRPGMDTEESLKELLHYVAVECKHPVDPAKAHWVAKLEERLPLKLSPVTVLREGYAFPGTERFGECGSMSELIGAIARIRGMPVRMVLLDDAAAGGEHKMVSVWHDGGYRLLDPAFDHYWVNEEGRIATIEEVRDNPEIFAQVFQKHEHYPYRLDKPQYFRWSRLGPMEGFARSVVGLFVGAKGVEEMDTPAFIDRPWLGYGWACLFMAVPPLFLGWLTRPRRATKHPESTDQVQAA
ncbi:MAG: hypothetical protein HRF45_05545 [Fimbriimonadia bacterium]|jgi:hypothetical protein